VTQCIAIAELEMELIFENFAICFQPNSPLSLRKPLQPDIGKHHDEEDSCSVASSYPLFDCKQFSSECIFNYIDGVDSIL
jgi:CMP-N-acetylneuraminic acid synthetase